MAYTKQLALRVTPEQAEMIRAAAERAGQPVSWWVRRALERALAPPDNDSAATPTTVRTVGLDRVRQPKSADVTPRFKR